MSDTFKEKVLLFADQDVGYKTLEFIIAKYSNSLIGVVTIGSNEITKLAETNGISDYDFNSYGTDWLIENLQIADYIILAWWPKIISREIIDYPKIGVINFHPSFLPFNRGKNYNFWTLVEKSRFGVSLHFVDEGIDTGDIIFQKEISKSWEDTGESLYFKAKFEMLELFKDNYSNILNGNYSRVKQDKTKGSFHYAKELEIASRLELSEVSKIENLLNLLRARTFSGKPSCYFIEDGIKYEVRISISRENN